MIKYDMILVPGHLEPDNIPQEWTDQHDLTEHNLNVIVKQFMEKTPNVAHAFMIYEYDRDSLDDGVDLPEAKGLSEIISCLSIREFYEKEKNDRH